MEDKEDILLFEQSKYSKFTFLDNDKYDNLLLLTSKYVNFVNFVRLTLVIELFAHSNLSRLAKYSIPESEDIFGDEEETFIAVTAAA